MTDLLAALRAAEVSAQGVIRDRALPQKDLREIEQFGEAEREIISQVGKGERAEAILRANHSLHLIQHAPTPAEPYRFEIRSISEPANPMGWVALVLVAMMATLFAWQQHGRRSAVGESDHLRTEIGTLNATIRSMKEENERQKSALASYPTEMKFDYSFTVGKAQFNVWAIYHDAKSTYIKSDATEKVAVYEVRDGSPSIVKYELRNGTYIIAKVLDVGYFEVGKKRMKFTRNVQQ